MKVLAVAGSSGGHIYPALSFLRALKDGHNEADALLILPQRARSFLIPGDVRVRYIPGANLTLKINSKNAAAFFEFLKGLWQSFNIVISYKPDITVGFGSIDSIAVVLFSWLFRIKTIVHEQNVICGRANRLLCKFADMVAISFAQTRPYLSISQDRVVLTGNPLRKELVRIQKGEARDFFGLDKDKFTVLVVGGSQGSGHINSVFAEVLSKTDDLPVFQAIHICGSKDYGCLSDKYKNSEVKIKLLAYLDKMHYAYSASDLVICRAGATTVAELLYFDLPAVIIPYPFAYAHQVDNAKVMYEAGRAVIINDSDLDAAKLRQTLLELVCASKKNSGIMRMPKDKADDECSAARLANLAVLTI